jgi:uncharacterized protein (DUF2461 family)
MKQRTHLQEDERTELIAAIRARLNVLRVQIDGSTGEELTEQLKTRLERLERLYNRMIAGELHVVGDD